MILSFLLAFLAVFLTAISQILLKIGSKNRTKEERYSFLAKYLNIPAISAYGLLLVVTIISVTALREVPLKLFYVIASLNLVVVIALSKAILKENINKTMTIGIVLIFVGMMVFNIY